MRVSFWATISTASILLCGFIGPVTADVPGKSTSNAPKFYAYRVREDGGIAAFVIAPNGDLSELPFVEPVSEPSPPSNTFHWEDEVELLRHPRLSVLYSVATQFHSGEKNVPVDYQVRVFGVGANGKLTQRQKIVLPQPPRAFSPDGKRLYVPDRADKLKIYDVSAEGNLRAIGVTAGGGLDDAPQAGVADDYGLLFAPSGRFAYRINHSAMLDSSWTNVERFRVLPNRQLIKGDKGGSPYAPSPDDEEESIRGGDLFFSGDGRTALMGWHDGKVLAFAVYVNGKLRAGEVKTPQHKRSDGWENAKISGFDRAGRCVLLLPDLNPPKDEPPFRIGLVTGAGKLRETARFGAFTPPASDAPPIPDPELRKEPDARPELTYTGRLRRDNIIDAIAWLGNAYSAYGVCYEARFRLRPDGTVTLEKPWAHTKKEGVAWDGDEPILRTVFVEAPRSPHGERKAK